jgi:hypothetical protein
MSTLPQAILDAADISAITQLILRERESRDLGNWSRMRDCFHPDSLVRLSWFSGTGYAFVDGSMEMARRNVMATHRLGPIHVRLAGDRALASLSAIIDIPALIADVELQLSSHARFLYRTERRAQQWRISGFDAIYHRDELVARIPGQVVPVTAKQLAPHRASYRMLSYLLTTQGYRVNANLPGDDRPDTTAALVQEIFGWAGLEP